VGLASYLLIGYWYQKPTACAAAIKAFIVNRVGDLGFALGIALIFVVFGSVTFDAIFAGVAAHQNDSYSLFGASFRAYEVIGILLFIGAMGKSAQLGLHVWLPDAMEGPTPVSALIHAATMVTAGVFLMARMSPVLEYAPYAMGFVTLVGASTALFAATVGCVQNDVKRIIAYSTCSQLGYMFIAAGVGAYQASVFHLLTHAFFKALLFLGAGSVIHAMSDEQDIRRMGGIWKKIPLTYAMMWIGSLALAGVFPFAGFYSKDAVLEAAYASHGAFAHYGFWCGILAAFLTAFYSWRLLILTFHGAPRADQHTMDHVHESPISMTGPLLLLAAGAVLTGMVFNAQLVGEHWQHFWGASIHNGPDNHVLHDMHNVPGWVVLLPAIVGIAGIALAYAIYMGAPALPARLAVQFSGVYRFLLNKWYFDELYNAIIVRPLLGLARGLWQVGDATIIDGIPNGVASLTAQGAGRVVRVQTGSIAHYAFAMLIGVVVLVSLYLIIR
jgi:NADH-quinone oxidoreductase subunit L